jgi:hypothetical protein
MLMIFLIGCSSTNNFLLKVGDCYEERALIEVQEKVGELENGEEIFRIAFLKEYKTKVSCPK